MRTMPALPIDPFSPDYLAHPALWHRGLHRHRGPVHLPALRCYALGTHAQVTDALTDWQHFSSADGIGHTHFNSAPGHRPPSPLLETDPPRHDAPSAALQHALGPATLTVHRGTWATRAEEFLHHALRATTIDAVHALAEPWVLGVFGDLVGITGRGRDVLLPFAHTLFDSFGPQQGAPVAEPHRAWVTRQCARDAVAPGGVGDRLYAAAERGDITPEQATRLIGSLLSAGIDTTVHALSSLLHTLATHPDLYAALRAQPALISPAIDEALRRDTPIKHFFRTTTTDTPIGGRTIPARSKVLLSYAAANHDPDHWATPHRFDLTRDTAGHLGFGTGIHRCAGQHIARAEIAALLTALTHQVEHIQLAGTPRRITNNMLNGWATLPLTLRTTPSPRTSTSMRGGERA